MKTELKQRMNKVSARSLDGNVVMGMAEWNAIVNLVSNLLAEPVASVPQDVEGFIAFCEFDKEDVCSGCIPSSRLRAWMAGHARVPVDVLETILEVVRGKLNEAYQNAMPVCCKKSGQECCGNPVAEWNPSDMELMDSLGPVEKTISAMLTASKERTE